MFSYASAVGKPAGIFKGTTWKTVYSPFFCITLTNLIPQYLGHDVEYFRHIFLMNFIVNIL